MDIPFPIYSSSLVTQCDETNHSSRKRLCLNSKCPFRQGSSSKSAEFICRDSSNKAKHIPNRAIADESLFRKLGATTACTRIVPITENCRLYQRRNTNSRCATSLGSSPNRTSINYSLNGDRHKLKFDPFRRSELSKSSPPKFYKDINTPVLNDTKCVHSESVSDLTKSAIDLCKIIRRSLNNSPEFQIENEELILAADDKYPMDDTIINDQCLDDVTYSKFCQNDSESCKDMGYSVNLKTHKFLKVMQLNVPLGIMCLYNPPEGKELTKSHHPYPTELRSYLRSVLNITQLNTVGQVSVTGIHCMECNDQYSSKNGKINFILKKNVSNLLRVFEVVHRSEQIHTDCILTNSITLPGSIEICSRHHVHEIESIGFHFANSRNKYIGEILSRKHDLIMVDSTSGEKEKSLIFKRNIPVDISHLFFSDNTEIIISMEEICYESQGFLIKNVNECQCSMQAPLQFNVICEHVDLIDSVRINEQVLLLNYKRAVNCFWKAVEVDECITLNSTIILDWDQYYGGFFEKTDVEDILPIFLDVHPENEATNFITRTQCYSSSSNGELKSVDLSYSRQQSSAEFTKLLLKRWIITTSFLLFCLLLAKYSVFSLQLGDWTSICGAGFAYLTVFFLFFLNAP